MAKDESGDWTVKPFLAWVAGSIILIIAFGLEGLAISALWFIGMVIWFFTRLTYDN